MAAKVLLGQRPKTFKPFTVKFTGPDGTEYEILATFKYRTVEEFGAWLDELFNQAEASAKAEAAAALTAATAKDKSGEDGAPAQPTQAALDYFKKLFSGTSKKNAAHILGCLDAADVEWPLNQANIEQFCNELPAGAAAMMASYNIACREGRLGNS